MTRVDPTWLTFLILLFFIVIGSAFQLNVELFKYQRDLIWPEMWRIWTGHLVHANVTHLLLNAIAILLVPFIFPKVRIQHLLLLIILISFLTSIEFYLFMPELQNYVGFSGVLHGVYVALTLPLFTIKAERTFAIFILVAILAKLSWEWFNGALATGALIQTTVLTEAHLFGAINGLLIGALYVFVDKKFNQL